MENLDKAISTYRLLVAQPFMLDPYFKRAVVLICEHHIEGTVGFILNKSVEMQINELLTDFPEFDAEVYYGGPVQTDSLHYVHNVGHLLDNSLKVAEGVYWGGDFDQLKVLIKTGVIQPHNIRFFVGYSGWSTGQLVGEMTSGSWIMADIDANYVFKLYDYPNELWEEVLSHKGDRYSVIGQMPEFLSWN